MSPANPSSRNYDKLPPELVEEHDRFMAQVPIAYRGHLIRPLSHRYGPYFDRGKFSYWGWSWADSPGAVWFESIGSAKTAIDCFHEAGRKPEIRQYGIPEAPNADTLRREWTERYWALMKEREVGCAGASGPVPYTEVDGIRYLGLGPA